MPKAEIMISKYNDNLYASAFHYTDNLETPPYWAAD